MHAWRQFRKFELLGRLHNYAGSAGRRGGSSTADLLTQSRLLALAIGPWAARKGILLRELITRELRRAARRDRRRNTFVKRT